jgi:hypothetical protein
MPRIARLHRLEPAEHECVNADLRLIREKIKTIYTLVDQRFGVSDKKALRLQALNRKLEEVEILFSDMRSSASAATM